MIVTKGSVITVEIGGHPGRGWKFKRTADFPGVCTVTQGGETLNLPANKVDSEEFIAAYRRIVNEDIKYREIDMVSTPRND